MPCAWYSANGERFGAYKGHIGALWTVDVDPTTTFLATGGADNTLRLWEVKTGRELKQWEFLTSIRRCEFSEDGKRLLGVFRSLDYRKDKVQLIVNRHEKNGDIKLRDVETAFSATDIRTIPNHYDAAAASVNQGVPVLKLAKSSPISRALQEFADALCPEEAPASTGWLSRVLKRA